MDLIDTVMGVSILGNGIQKARDMEWVSSKRLMAVFTLVNLIPACVAVWVF